MKRRYFPQPKGTKTAHRVEWNCNGAKFVAQVQAYDVNHAVNLTRLVLKKNGIYPQFIVASTGNVEGKIDLCDFYPKRSAA